MLDRSVRLESTYDSGGALYYSNVSLLDLLNLEVTDLGVDAVSETVGWNDTNHLPIVQAVP